MRKLILTGTILVAASAIAVAFASGARHGRSMPAPRAPLAARGEVDRVASALGLSGETRAALAKAQLLGREATACLLDHGASRGPDGGIADPDGTATEACAAEIQANETYQNSPEFAAVLRAAAPRFAAAERCFRRLARIPAGVVLPSRGVAPEVRQRVEHAQATCFRPDGLPR